MGKSLYFGFYVRRNHRSLESEDDQETWGLLRVLLEDDGTARTKLITHLGFSIPEETNESVPDDLSREVNALGLEDTTSDKVGLGSDKEATIFPTDNGEDFFNNLPSPKADTPVSTSGDKFSEGDTVPFANEMQQEPDGLEESADPSFDESVQHALVVGDYKGAVAKCISANKMVIAHAVGASLWESTRDQYLKMSHSPYLKIVSAMVSNDLLSLVNSRPLKFWKETLALLCSFASRDEWTVLCDTLASKLIVVGNTLAATFWDFLQREVAVDLTAWFQGVALTRSAPELEQVMMCMWALWNERNQVVWNECRRSVAEIVSGAIRLLHESYELQHQSLIPTSRVKAKWQRPPLGVIKINLGGDFRAATGIGGIGIVTRDHEGIFLGIVTSFKEGAFVCPKMA